MQEAFAISLTLALGLALDWLFAEPKRLHPLVGFGNCANWLEQRFNQAHLPSLLKRICGASAWLILIVPWVLLAFWLSQLGWLLIDAVVVYWAIGLSSLKQHALRVVNWLAAGNLNNARKFAGYMVSRDTSELTEDEVSRATVESVLENGHDGVIAPLVWFVIGGIPAVVLFRLANTLDAMWGYKNQRFYYFGWWAARADDVLGWIPARVCALLYALVGKTKQAIHCWIEQGKAYKSPNAGPVMASGAAALLVSIGGGARYNGQFVDAPKLGCGKPVSRSDIAKSLQLVKKSSWLLVGLIFSFEATKLWLL